MASPLQQAVQQLIQHSSNDFAQFEKHIRFILSLFDNNLSQDTFIRESPTIVQWLQTMLNIVLPTPELSVQQETLLSVEKKLFVDVILNAVVLFQDTAARLALYPVPFQVTGHLFIYALIFKCVSPYNQLNNATAVTDAFTNLIRIKQLEDGLTVATSKLVIEWLKLRGNTTSWTSFFINATIFHNMCQLIDDQQLPQHVYNLLSPAIQLIEDLYVSSQLVGLSCLNRLLSHKFEQYQDSSCYSILKSNGYDELLYIKLKRLLYQPDAQTVRVTVHNIYLLLKDGPTQNVFRTVNFSSSSIQSLQTALQADSHLEDIFKQLINNLVLGSGTNDALAECQLDVLREYIFPLMQCTLAKYSKMYLHANNFLLQQPLTHFRLTVSCLQTLENFLITISTNLSSSQCQTILTSLTRLAIQMRFDQFEERELIFYQICRVLHLLASSPHASVNQTVVRFSKATRHSSVLWPEISLSSPQLVKLIQSNAAKDIIK